MVQDITLKERSRYFVLHGDAFPTIEDTALFFATGII